jgi:hypothetical protein
MMNDSVIQLKKTNSGQHSAAPPAQPKALPTPEISNHKQGRYCSKPAERMKKTI